MSLFLEWVASDQKACVRALDYAPYFGSDEYVAEYQWRLSWRWWGDR